MTEGYDSLSEEMYSIPGMKIIDKVLKNYPRIDAIIYGVPNPAEDLPKRMPELGKDVVYVDYDRRCLKKFMKVMESCESPKSGTHYVSSAIEATSFKKPVLYVMPYVTQLDHVDERFNHRIFLSALERYDTFVSSIMEKQASDDSLLLILNQDESFLTEGVVYVLMKDHPQYNYLYMKEKSSGRKHLLVSRKEIPLEGWR